MLATTATPALLRCLHHLLVLTPSVLEPDFHLQAETKIFEIGCLRKKNEDKIQKFYYILRLSKT